MTDTQQVPATFAGPAAAGASDAPAAGGPLMLSAVAAKIQRPRLNVPVYLDAELAPQIADAEEALRLAVEYDKTTNEDDTAPAIARHVQELEDAAAESKVIFVLQALPHRTYQTLQTQYPPTAEQIETASKAAGEARDPAFDPDAFAPVLVRAQLISPQVDSDDVFDGFWEELNDGQLRQLWQSALTVQLGVTDPGPKSELASEILGSFGLS